jgi:hypothetical protein
MKFNGFVTMLAATLLSAGVQAAVDPALPGYQ